MIAHLAIAAVSGVVGACVGSFTATAALRAAHGEQAVFGRSRCDACGVGLSFTSTVPVLSFVRSRGICASCGSTIDPLHFVGEVAGATIGATVAIVIALPGRAGLLAALGFVLLGIAAYDARTKRIPDVLVLAVVAVCGALAALRSIEALEIGAVAAVAAFAILELLRRTHQLARAKPGLGSGDVKLVAALALWLGLATPWAIAAAAGAGLIAFATLRPASGRIAFGPFIALCAWLTGMACEGVGWPRLG